MNNPGIDFPRSWTSRFQVELEGRLGDLFAFRDSGLHTQWLTGSFFFLVVSLYVGRNDGG